MSDFRWIPIAWKESKGEEEDGFPKGVMITWSDMPMPGDEILISSNRNGFVDTDIALEDDEGCYLESGLDWEEVDAWMPMPPPYRADEESEG